MIFGHGEGLRRRLAWTLADLLAAGHELTAALGLLAPRARGWGAAVRSLQARVEQGQPPHAPELLPGELGALLEVPMEADVRRSALAALGEHLRRVGQTARSPLLVLAYPLSLALVLVLTAQRLLRLPLPAVQARPLTVALGSAPALAAVLLSGLLWAYLLWWRREGLRPASWLSGLAERVVSVLPGVRAALLAPACATAARSLALTLAAGVPTERALWLAAAACKHQGTSRALGRLASRLRQGIALADATVDVALPAPLSAALRYADPIDLPRALELAAAAAAYVADRAAARLQRIAFATALLLVAAGVGALLLEAYGAISLTPAWEGLR